MQLTCLPLDEAGAAGTLALKAPVPFVSNDEFGEEVCSSAGIPHQTLSVFGVNSRFPFLFSGLQSSATVAYHDVPGSRVTPFPPASVALVL